MHACVGACGVVTCPSRAHPHLRSQAQSCHAPRRGEGAAASSSTKWIFAVTAPTGTTSLQLQQLEQAIAGGGSAAALFDGSPYDRSEGVDLPQSFITCRLVHRAWWRAVSSASMQWRGERNAKEIRD